MLLLVSIFHLVLCVQVRLLSDCKSRFFCADSSA